VHQKRTARHLAFFFFSGRLKTREEVKKESEKGGGGVAKEQALDRGNERKRGKN
jgi:hypothetical protein